MFRRQLLAAIAGLALIVAVPMTMSAQGDQATARVSVVHLAPFDADDTTVTVTVEGAALGSLEYKDSVPAQTLPAGDYDVAIYAGPTATGSPVLTDTLTLAAGKAYTVLAVGDKVGDGPGNIPLQLLTLENDATAPAAGNYRLRVVHAAPFAAQAQTGVDIALENGTPVPGLQNVPFGANSPYLSLPAATPLDVRVLAAGTQNLVFNPPALSGRVGQIFTAVAVGGANGYQPELFLIEENAGLAIYLPAIFNGAAPTGEPTTTTTASPSTTTTTTTTATTTTATTTTASPSTTGTATTATTTTASPSTTGTATTATTTTASPSTTTTTTTASPSTTTTTTTTAVTE